MRRLTTGIFAALSLIMVADAALQVPVLSPGPNAEQLARSPDDALQWVSLVDGFHEGASPVITILESTADRTLMHVVIPGFWVESSTADGLTCQKLTIPDESFTAEVGAPQLPIIHALVAVPFGADPSATVRSASETILTGYYVCPCTPPAFDHPAAHAEPLPDAALAQDLTLYPGQVVSLSPPGVWRDLNVVRVDLAAVRYDQATQSLVIINDALVEIEHPNSAGMLQDARRAISPQFDALYQSQVLNYASLDSLNRRAAGGSASQYLIITHPNFAAAIQPLADWHKRAGMDTEILEITTTNPQVIKNAIVERYNQGGLEYVLLVGDPGYIPLATWSYASDYWYACITGAPDLYADIALGRLSVTNNTQLERQVAKTLAYMTNPAEGSWLTQTLLVAHMAGGEFQYRACKEYIRTTLIPGTPFTVSTAYGDTSGVNNALVTSRINAGQGIVNYRGHGMGTLWWQWNIVPEDWTTANVHALNNGGYTPIVFNVACQTHRIQDAAESLGEAWLNKYPGGAVASLGATDDGITYPNQNYDKQLYRAFCQESNHRLGWISNSAATYILVHDPTYAPWNVKMYLWLGDPALEVWTTKTPAALDVTHPATALIGSSEFAVSVSADGVPLDDALVCLWKEGEVYQTQSTTGGLATFGIAPATPGTLAVTVTKHNYLPYTADVTVGLLLADVNGDGSVNVFDIDPFVLALTMGEAEFLSQHATWHYWAADCNQDGAINVFDIDPFVALLTGGGE